MTWRVIIGQHAQPVAARIKEEGDPGVKAAYSWLIDHLQADAAGLGIEIPGAKDNARTATVGDVIAAWTIPAEGSIVILRILMVLPWRDTHTPLSGLDID